MGEWKAASMSSVCDSIVSGSTPPTSDSACWEGLNVWITPNDLSSVSTPHIDNSARKLTSLGVRRATRKLLPAYSVIISIRAPVGYCAVVTVPFTFNQGCKGLICNKNTDPLYVYYCLSASKAQLERVSSGTTFLELPKKELVRFVIKLPKEKAEQIKVAEILSAADEAIEKTRTLIEKYTSIKAGMMQDLLGNGDRVRLGNVVESFKYGLNASAKPYDGESKYIRITDIDEQNRLFSKENLTSPSGFLQDAYLLQENDIVFARTGASTGKTYLYSPSDGKVYFAGFLVRARVKDAYDSRFVFYHTQSDSYKRWVQIMSLRSGQPGINAKEYAQYQFHCPTTKSEQTRIADMLTAADEKIQTEQAYLVKLQNIKRGLMQDLLNNTISVDALL